MHIQVLSEKEVKQTVVPLCCGPSLPADSFANSVGAGREMSEQKPSLSRT